MWIVLIACQAGQLLSLAPWLLMAGLSFMAFDAPGSEKSWPPWAFVLTIWSYPLWLVAGCATAWVSFGKGWRRTALGITIAFTLPALIALLWLAVVSRM